MMKKLLLAVALLAGMVQVGFARTVEQQLVSSLLKQGYVVLEQGYTFLGRLRIVAENAEYRREIVVNPGTGEILRDYAVSLQRLSSEFARVTPAAPGSGVSVFGSGAGNGGHATGVAVATTTDGGSAGGSADTPTAGDMPDFGIVADDATEFLLPEFILPLVPGLQ